MDKQTAIIIVGLFADLVLVAQFFIVSFILIWILSHIFKKNKLLDSFIKFFTQNAITFAFIVALVAMIGSLFFSEIAHFVPCKLCWYQRICMYPQVLLLGIATVKNDIKVKMYALPLAIIGLVIAIYHYALQMSPLPLPCTDEVASCAAKQAAHFGYITIPLMSLTAFVLIIIFLLLVKNKK